MGRWVGLWRVSGPSLLGTPISRRLANFPLPECPGRTSLLPFFLKKNNFAFGCHNLHSPVRRSEVRNITREFKSHNSSADRALLRSAGVRIRPPCSRLESCPQTNPPFPHPSLPLPLSSAKAAACCKDAFNPPTPRSKILPDGWGVCACARRGNWVGGGGSPAVAWKGRSDGERGRGWGSGPASSSQRVPAPALARLSFVCAKNPLQSLFPERGQPLVRAADQASHPFQSLAVRRGRRAQQRGRSLKSPGNPERPLGVPVPLPLRRPSFPL